MEGMKKVSNRLDEMGTNSFTEAELPIIQRVIHATADFDYAKLLRFSKHAIEKGIEALQSGCTIISDVQMIAAGVSQLKMDHFGCQITCAVSDPKIAELSRITGKTRSELAIHQYGELLNGSIVAIGNAPTALFEVLRLFKAEQIRPALVVGVPVGFVNAVESKEALLQTPLDYITSVGRKGGSTVAVAILNALLRLAEA